MRHLVLLLLVALSAAAQETWDIFYTPDTAAAEDAAALHKRVVALLPQGVRVAMQPLPADLKDKTAAAQHARAIAAGVHTLPCLVLQDERGAYAVLPLQGLTPTIVKEAQKLAHSPRRDEEARQRTDTARLYYRKAMWALARTPAEQDAIISAWREEMQKEGTPPEMRQFIGLRCLYPALMQQYATEYTGAHTPRTEAKLLEAISTLEEVRDTDPESLLGRQAYDERERLRAARLKSRQYE